MTIEYLIEPQKYVDRDNNTRLGKLISAIEERLLGQTGYVEWNRDAYENNGKNTAKFMRVNKWYEIIVFVEKRGIGFGLMDRLLDELVLDGFDQLIIEGVMFYTKGFYDTVLKKLKKKGKILSSSCDVVSGYGLYIPGAFVRTNHKFYCYDYDVSINTKSLQTTQTR